MWLEPGAPAGKGQLGSGVVEAQDPNPTALFCPIPRSRQACTSRIRGTSATRSTGTRSSQRSGRAWRRRAAAAAGTAGSTAGAAMATECWMAPWAATSGSSSPAACCPPGGARPPRTWSLRKVLASSYVGVEQAAWEGAGGGAGGKHDALWRGGSQLLCPRASVRLVLFLQSMCCKAMRQGHGTSGRGSGGWAAVPAVRECPLEKEEQHRRFEISRRWPWL